MKQKLDNSQSLASLLTEAGVDPRNNHGSIAPPVARASTIAYETHDDFIHQKHPHKYGRHGSNNCDAVKQITNKLERADHTLLTCSGLSALTLTLCAHLKPNAHILVVDSVYGGLRKSLPTLAGAFSATVEYYDPHCSGPDLEKLIRPETTAIFAESPGSLTFQIQDISALIEVANRRKIPIIVDNTWSAGLYFQPLDLGADYVVQSLSKYVAGHSDILAGAVMFRNPPTAEIITQLHRALGLRLADDEAWLILRGARSLLPRMRQQQDSGIQIAKWLETLPQVAAVRHPALPSHPQHDLWKQYFSGASSLFAIELAPVTPEALDRFMDALSMFHMGLSFGGYDSLITSFDCSHRQNGAAWPATGRGIRIYVGLADVQDLIADLSNGFEALAQHA